MSSNQPPKPKRAWIILLPYIILLLGSAALAVWGGTNPTQSSAIGTLLPAGIVAFFLTAGLFPIAIVQVAQRSRQIVEWKKTTEGISNLLQQVHEHTMLSDSAKRIAYRREERQMLRKAIEEDIATEDWEAAMVLVRDMADQFGYVEEAEEFRRHIEDRRADVMGKRLREAIERFESLIGAREWTAAYAEAARISRLFPDAPQAQDLVQHVRQAWQEHKHALERQFLDAAGQSDVEDAMEILRELDSYLTPREAEPYREIARGVIGKARDNLGLQFKLAVRNQDWTNAVNVGEQIMEDFPNSLMAREVRERIGILRVRATEAAGVGVPMPAAGVQRDESTAPAPIFPPD